jgi:hypothetical protein
MLLYVYASTYQYNNDDKYMMAFKNVYNINNDANTNANVTSENENNYLNEKCSNPTSTMPYQNAIAEYDYDPSTPPIDGNQKSPSQMFTFAFNKSSPECCLDSGYSTSKGCICLTNEQKKWFGQRGNNNQTLKCEVPIGF